MKGFTQRNGGWQAAAFALTSAAVVLTGLVIAVPSAYGEPPGVNPRATARAAATGALSQHLDAIRGSAADKYTVYSSTVDPNGAAHVRFTRTYHGLPVYGGDFIVHLAPGGAYSSTTVGLAAPLNIGTAAAVPASQAQDVALRHFAGQVGRVVEAPKLVVDAVSGHGRLVWETVISGQAPDGTPSRLHVLTDAHTGSFVRSWDEIQTLSATTTSVPPAAAPSRPAALAPAAAAPATAAAGTGKSLLGGTVPIDTTLSGTSYTLIDPSHGGNSACDMNNGLTTCKPFTSNVNTWGTGKNSDRASAAVDAYYGAAMTFDYFKNVLGRAGVFGNGTGVPSRVHYGNGVANAFWDGGQMTYGDGVGNATPLVELDVAGHEMTHGLTNDLVTGMSTVSKTGETAGLIEATSDIMGEMVEFYAKNPAEPGDYKIGAHLKLFKDGSPLRYMFHPSLDAPHSNYNPNKTSQDCWTPSTAKPITAKPSTASLDGHYSSGVGNHFFFDLAQGTGDTSYGYSPVCGSAPSVTGIGRDKAAKIWFKAMQNYFTSTTTYVDTANPGNTARAATLRAASDLYGMCSVEYRTVQAAWTAVNVAGSDAACPGYPAGGHADDVLFIHGFLGLSSNGSNSTVQGGCAGTWDTAISAFRMMGWTGRLRTVGYYAGDYQNGNSCDIQFDSQAPGSAHVSGCDSYFFTPADEGTNNQDLRNLSCQLAWYIYNNYTAKGHYVWVVAHSMGGLIIRDAVDEVNRHNSAYPPFLYIPGVVQFGTPNGGIPSPGAAGFVCGACIQASNMQTGAGAPSAFIDNLTAETYAPTGSPGVPTDWTVVTSSGESWTSVVDPRSALNFPNSRPGYPPVHKVEYTSTPGTNPSPYDHGGYLKDSSASANATARKCDNCGTPQTADATSYHSLLLASTALSRTPPPIPAHPVQNQPGGGAFFDGWQSVTGVYGPLGDPSSAFRAITGGQEQDFTGGGIYWSAGPGTHEVHGAIHADYAALGGPTGAPVGFPATDERDAPGGGRENLFAGSSCGLSRGSAILWTAATGAGEMQGCIYQAYLTRYGGPAGSLGYPTSNERPIATGRVSYMAGTSCGPAAGSALYWDGAVHAVYGCIFQEYKKLGEADSSLGFPAGDEYASGGGRRQDFQNGTITYINGVTQVSYKNWVVGHARHAGNDYPYETIGQFGHQSQGTDAWAEYYGQCDSFGAWKVYENLAGAAAQHPAIVPAPGWTPSNASISPVNQRTWYNADNWNVMWAARGYAVDAIPAPGSIAYWPNATPDPQDGHPTSANGLGEFGHVGYVTDVYPDGSITVEMYNMRENGQYSVVHMAYQRGYTDNSFGLANFNVPWPTAFIHVADGPAAGVASPPEPASGVVQATYASQVKVIGPGSSPSQFSTGNDWFGNPGFGEIGQEKYTHTNGPTPLSTATWTPSGLAAGTCYQVDAFVPDEYSDNPVAVYTVRDAKGTSMAAVNENQTTSDWAELGVFQTGTSGGITIRLDDRGTTGLWVAADAMRFWRRPSCSGYGNVSPIVGPSSHSSGWTAHSGHGFFGNQLYSPTHGTTVVDTAAYTPHLIPLDCYEVFAYVPDNHSDNNAARYWVMDQWYGAFWPQVNENSFTNQFTDLGMFMARTDGSLRVTLQDIGPAGQFVSADALAYTLDTNCKGIGESGTGMGHVYQPDQIGPGSAPQAFSTTNQWYTRLGHGYANHELWTYDNGTTADSTATWTFHGDASTCYSVSAFIPDNFADNPQAHYTVGTTLEGFGFTFDQATATGWSDLGALTTGSNGVITVTLNDIGPTNPMRYTAADAMQFAQGGSGC